MSSDSKHLADMALSMMKTVAKFPKGEPADPKSNMTPDQAKKWDEMNDKHRDKFKTADEMRRLSSLLGMKTAIKQMLMPKAIARKIPKLYSQEDNPDPIVWVVFFNPYGRGYWLITEFDGRERMFGLVDLGHPELGYISLSALENMKTNFGAQQIERDSSWKPMPLSEAAKKKGISWSPRLASLAMMEGRVAKEKYPWDQCIKDQMEQYGDEETAEKVCGKIKSESQGKTAKVSPKSKEGTRVVMNANPASRLLYRNPPENGTEGTVTGISLGSTKRTFMPGPGGGLLYVKWDDGNFMGVSPNDLDKAPKSKRADFTPGDVVDDGYNPGRTEPDDGPEGTSEGSQIPDGFGNTKKRARLTWKTAEDGVNMWALVKGNNMLAATDNPAGASPRHWRRFAGVGDVTIVPLASVPLALAEQLKDHGTRARPFVNGEQAWNAVKQARVQAGKPIRLASDELIAEGCPGNLDEDECKEWETNTEKYKDKFKTAAEGLYGFTKGVQRDCEASTRKVGRIASSIARRAYGKDAKVAEFLATHAKRAKNLPAKVIIAAMKDIGPKVALAHEDRTPEQNARIADLREKQAAAGGSKYGLYGFRSKTANLGLTACAELREKVGSVAYDLHARRTAKHAQIVGFLKTHCKEAKCANTRLLADCYPDADVRVASPVTMDDWLAWEEN